MILLPCDVYAMNVYGPSALYATAICLYRINMSEGMELTFWPTVLSVVPLAQCLVCLSVVVSDVLYCGETVRPSEKVSEGVNRKPGSKSSFFGSPPYFYFLFRRYSYRDGRFCLIFARTAKQLVLDGRN